MSDVKLKDVEFNDTTDDLHYVEVAFESRYNKGNNDFYLGKTYNYATRRDLKEGDIIEISTMYGTSKVKILKENVDPSTFDFDLSLLKEI